MNAQEMIESGRAKVAEGVIGRDKALKSASMARRKLGRVSKPDEIAALEQEIAALNDDFVRFDAMVAEGGKLISAGEDLIEQQN